MAVAKSLNDASSSTSAKEYSDEQVINYINMLSNSYNLVKDYEV